MTEDKNIKSEKKRRPRDRWMDKYEGEYGICPIETDPETNEVKAAQCQFCTHFGREGTSAGSSSEPTSVTPDATSTKRRRKSTVKVFQAFRPDNLKVRILYVQAKSTNIVLTLNHSKVHMSDQHATKWAAYQEIRGDESLRSMFFRTDGSQESYSPLSSSLTIASPVMSRAPLSSSPPPPDDDDGNLAHVLPTNWKSQIQAFLQEDIPAFDVGGYVVGGRSGFSAE